MSLKEKILIVEDDELYPNAWKTAIEGAGDDATEVLIARSVQSAMEAAEAGDIAYCILDLNLPRRDSENPVEDEYLGFEVLKHVAERNKHVEITIVSKFADFASVLKEKTPLSMEGLPIKRMLDKSKDPDYLNAILQDIAGLREAATVLDRLGVRVVHILERRIVRLLWKKAGERCTAWPTPILVFRGETRSGKDFWAKVYHRLRIARQQLPARDPVTYDLGQLGRSSSGEEAKIRLFGARNFQGVRNSPGVFELAGTNAAHQPDFTTSNVLILHELGNLPDEWQPLFLKILDPDPEIGGRVNPAGTAGPPVLVGCPIVFTTNATLENRVAKSDSAKPGEIREDLFLRLKREPWIYVPSAFDIGFEAFQEHLSSALQRGTGRRIDIAPAAIDFLQRSFAERHPGITLRLIDDIVDAYRREPSHRLTDAPIILLLGGYDKHANPSASDAANRQCWDIDKMKKKGVVSANTKEFYLLEFLLAKERFDQPVPNKDAREKEAIAYVNAHKDNINPTAGRSFQPMNKRGLSACKSILREALEQEKEAGIEIAQRECRALIRS